MTWMLVNAIHSSTSKPAPANQIDLALPPLGSRKLPSPPPPTLRARLSRSSSPLERGVRLREPPGGCAHGLRGPALSPPASLPPSSPPPASSPPLPAPHGLFGLSDMKRGRRRHTGKAVVMGLL